MRNFKMIVYCWTLVLIVCLELPSIQATICDGQENEHLSPEPCFDVSFYNYTVDRQSALGSELVLECYISYKSTYTVLWSHNGRVVAINDKVISPAETKLRVDSDSERRFNLVLSELDAAKNGTYECSVVSKTYPTLKYTVEVLVPPQITRSPSDDEIVVDEGGSLLVQCLTSGNPKPELTFSRHHGEKGKHTTIDVDNASMKLVNVDQSYAGQYSCIASNGVGLGATSEFNVFVRFKPRVTFVDNIQNVLYTSLGKQEQIKCIVDAYPRPVISLLQNGSPVAEQLYSLDKNNEVKDQYVLTYSFFGSAESIDYECIAKNDLGNTVAFLKVTPQVSAIKLSNTDLTYSDAVVFEWSLFSGSAPNELNVQVFTENSSTNFTTESKQMKPIALVDSEDVTSLSSIAIYHNENHISYKGYLDVIKLTPNTTYTIRLRVKNELNEWSDWSHNLTSRTSADESNRITLTKHRSLHNHYRMMHHDKKHKHYQLSGSRDLNGGKRDNYNPNMFENHASKPYLSLVSIVASFFFIKMFF